MGSLYDQSIFNKRGEAAKQQERSSNRLFLIVVVIGLIAVIGIAVWKWRNDPSRIIVNVNTATAEQLVYLPGVGPELAKEIIAGRPYSKPADLEKVKGIGAKTLEKITPRIRVE